MIEDLRQRTAAWNVGFLTSSALALALAAGPVAANPNERPEFMEHLQQSLDDGMQLSSVALSNEDLSRDGLDAFYFANFEANVVVGRSLFAAVDRQDGYVIVQQVISADDTVPATGNIVGAYQNGRWKVEANLDDLQAPGGKPFQSFRNGETVVLRAGADSTAAFIEARKEALTMAHELELAKIAMADEQKRLSTEREAARQALEAEKQAEVAEIKRTADRNRETRAYEERVAADAALLALFTVGETVKGQVTHQDRRVAALYRVDAVGGNHAEGTMTLNLGHDETYEAPFVLRTHKEPGMAVFEYKALNGFRGSRRNDCHEVGTINIEAGIIEFVNDRNHHPCKGAVLVEGLSQD